jgi:hypothetical protein
VQLPAQILPATSSAFLYSTRNGTEKRFKDSLVFPHFASPCEVIRATVIATGSVLFKGKALIPLDWSIVETSKHSHNYGSLFHGVHSRMEEKTHRHYRRRLSKPHYRRKIENQRWLIVECCALTRPKYPKGLGIVLCCLWIDQTEGRAGGYSWGCLMVIGYSSLVELGA